MKDIRLSGLTIRNFKGCPLATFDFDGHSASIYGDNAAGKTTIYDALTWLLFGKDSKGRGDFDIKPLGKDGQVLDHGAVTEVSAVFWADGESIALHKTYFEKWSTKRGSAEASYDGNTSEYYVDSVPVKKYEYERRAGELVSEDLFRMLTGVYWFCESMKWQDRRKVLFEVCGVASDREIMEGAEQFGALSAAMGKLTLDDYKKKLQSERRGLSGARESVPARLDECKKTVDDISQMDFVAVRAERATKAGQMEQLNIELLKLEHGALLDSKCNDLKALQNKLATYANENNSHRASQMVPVEDKRPAMEAALKKAKADFLIHAGLSSKVGTDIETTERRIQECRERWEAENARTFADATCATCGQALPKDAQDKARASFEADVARRKQDAVDASNHEKQRLAEAVERREQCIETAVSLENEIARLTAELEAYVPQEQPEIENLPGHIERMAAVNSEIDAVASDIAKLEGESATIRAEIDGKVADLQQEVDALDRELAKEAMLDYTKERMDKLREEAKAAGEALESLDKMLFLCDEFTRYKVRFVEDSINQRFRMVNFRLFQEQVNGGLADCCDAVVDGVPYSSLNNGARINAGLDVIETLSNHYGVTVPLIVDNAESVTSLLPVTAQVIRLVVSEDDKKLRCEYGA